MSELIFYICLNLVWQYCNILALLFPARGFYSAHREAQTRGHRTTEGQPGEEVRGHNKVVDRGQLLPEQEDIQFVGQVHLYILILTSFRNKKNY